MDEPIVTDEYLSRVGRPSNRKEVDMIDLSASNERFLEALVRARAEFLEMPGLKLTLDQAARLWALDGALCRSVLTALVESRFLIETKNAAFARSE
jgi:hypothetical protein